jgi:enhancer of yellow 2 transcription factor
MRGVLEEELRRKLIEQGWRDELKRYAKDLIRQRGIDKISMEDLVKQVAERGKATIKPEIKDDIVSKIRKLADDI